MLGFNWYHGLVRNYVILFGSLFNDIQISRVDSSNTEVQILNVPVEYGPKERYLTRAAENPDLLRPISYTYPRMAFEITDFKYDSDRKLNSIGKSTTGGSTTGTLKTQLNPVPYNINFRLSIITRNTDDALRIVEQIIPYFTPVLNVSVDLIPEMNYGPITIPITLNSVRQDEQYEGGFESKEFVIWTLDFSIKAYLYGPISSGTVIKNINVNFIIPPGNTVQESINIIPGVDANGNPTSLLANSIPQANISANSNYGFITTFTSDING